MTKKKRGTQENGFFFSRVRMRMRVRVYTHRPTNEGNEVSGNRKDNTVKENCLNKKLALNATHMPPMRHTGYALLCIMKREHRWTSAEQSTEAFAIPDKRKICAIQERSAPRMPRVAKTKSTLKRASGGHNCPKIWIRTLLSVRRLGHPVGRVKSPALCP